MYDLMFTILYFLLALCILITVHEFGHFWVARLCGVKVLRFSIGFGKSIFRWHDKKGTEYTLSAIPLGGYVKMLDETEGPVPEALLSQAFNRKPLGSRIAIVAAGPLFNFIFAVIALWLMFMIGIKTMAPIIGKVQANSPAAVSQLQAKDKIIQIANEPVSSWRQFQLQLMPFLGNKGQVSLKVQSIETGKIRHSYLKIDDWQINPKKPDLLQSLGIYPFIPKVKPIIDTVVAHGPAAQAGLLAGDELVAINDKKVNDWITAVNIIRKNPAQALQVNVLRNGRVISLKMTPAVKINQQKKYGYIGAAAKIGPWPKAYFNHQQYGFGESLVKSVEETWILTKSTILVIGKLITGKVSLRNISGPIGIAQGAGQSAQIGLAYYLAFLALVSISLGVLNILPIPMLDGGHLLYYLFELLLGKPLSEEVRTIGVNLGLLMILALMSLAIFNDIMRIMGS